MTEQTAIRCNACGEIVLARDEVDPQHLECPFCDQTESFSLRKPVKDAADARRLFAAEETHD